VSGNTGVAGGTQGADPVPVIHDGAEHVAGAPADPGAPTVQPKQTTAPDNSTVLDKDSPLVTTDTTPPEPPKPVG
jgi:hypothetical protein